MDNKMNRFKNGFTLIELLIICAIIAILSAIGIPIYQGYQSKFKEESAQNNLRSIRMTQSEIFRDTKSYYPCPSTKTNSSGIDKEMFGGKGDLLKSEYDYEITGGCSSFKVYAYPKNGSLRCYSIDNTGILSSDCGSFSIVSSSSSSSSSSISSPTSPTKSFDTYIAPAYAMDGVNAWILVDPAGNQTSLPWVSGGIVCSYDVCGAGGSFDKMLPSGYKFVAELARDPITGNVASYGGSGGMKYDWSSDTWTTPSGIKIKDGKTI
jgi:type II secretory pathway pseudopilin PulG